MDFKSDKYESAFRKVKPSNEGHGVMQNIVIISDSYFVETGKHTLFLSANQTSEE